jgi:hypothetical protein
MTHSGTATDGSGPSSSSARPVFGLRGARQGRLRRRCAIGYADPGPAPLALRSRSYEEDDSERSGTRQDQHGGRRRAVLLTQVLNTGPGRAWTDLESEPI